MRQVEWHARRALELDGGLVAARVARAIAQSWLEAWPSARAELHQAGEALREIPTEDEQRRMVGDLHEQAEEQLGHLRQLIEASIPVLNRQIAEAGLPWIKVQRQ